MVMRAGDLKQEDAPCGIRLDLQTPVFGVLSEVTQLAIGTEVTVAGQAYLLSASTPVSLAWPALRHIYLSDADRRPLVRDEVHRLIGRDPDLHPDDLEEL